MSPTVLTGRHSKNIHLLLPLMLLQSFIILSACQAEELPQDPFSKWHKCFNDVGTEEQAWQRKVVPCWGRGSLALGWSCARQRAGWDCVKAQLSPSALQPGWGHREEQLRGGEGDWAQPPSHLFLSLEAPCLSSHPSKKGSEGALSP